MLGSPPSSRPARDRIPALSTRMAAHPGVHAGGEAELVELSADHPGFHDADYRRRRNEIARLAIDYHEGDPAPRIAYTEPEHDVWRTVWSHLGPLHDRYACREYLAASTRVRFDRERIPQLADLNPLLESMHGFRMFPVAGLVSARMFLSYLSRRVFLSTQYMRHHAAPLYTPEPDAVHELVGHAPTFADESFVRASRLFGEAARLAEDEERMTQIARLYWYTLEFGLVREGFALKAVGAGLLSSFGELGRIEGDAELCPFDPQAIVETPYDPTDYQSALFVAPSFEVMMDGIETYLAGP
jgi:phenylalanine-4-hydroxylase